MTTWAEFKKLVEAQGVRDEDTIKGIDWIARLPRIAVHMERSVSLESITDTHFKEVE